MSNMKVQIVVRLALAAPIWGAIFFWPAGTFDYWEAWAYLAILFAAMIGIIAYFLQHDPDLLVHRMELREREMKQQWIVGLSAVYFLLAYFLPGFDQRYGWSDVPAWLALVGDVMVVLGFVFLFQVFKANSYASRVVVVEVGQEVISKGPYAWVRHPMYVSVLLVYVFSPLALGSYWAMIPTVALIVLLVARIRNEEQVLLRDLKGYGEYVEKVRWRLLPGIW